MADVSEIELQATMVSTAPRDAHGAARAATTVAALDLVAAGDEQHVVGREGRAALTGALDRLVSACLEFKLGDPFAVSPSAMDERRLRAVAAVEDAGAPLDFILEQFEREILPSSLNFGSPTFLAHPDAGNATAGILGEVANAFLQQNLCSADYAPAATRIELELLKVLRRVVGFRDGEEDDGAIAAGGAFVFGGAGANFACLLAAREHLKRKLARDGREFDPRRTRVLGNSPFTHGSLRRSLSMLGLGNRDLDARRLLELGVDEEALLEVDTTGFALDVDDLERKLEQVASRGESAMAVFAVAGDSRFMAFDDLQRIADVAERHDVWVHVDACEGGQVLFSPRRRHLMAGVERCHSVALDPHKFLLVPYNLSLFYLRDPECMADMSSDPEDVINQDERSLGAFTPAINSKGFISLKLLFMLKHWGWDRLAREIDRRHDLALRTARWVDDHPLLTLVNPDIGHNAVALVFAPGEACQPHALNALNEQIHTQLNMTTRYFIHGCPARDDAARVRPDRGPIYILRLMFGNPQTTWPVVEQALEAIVAIGTEALTRTSRRIMRDA